MKRIVIFVSLFMFLSKPWCEEMIPIERLRESALRNNIEIRMAEEALEVFTAESSILNNIRASSSYNFETQTYFYGFTCSIPFGFFKERRCVIDYKKLEIEKAKREVMRELEDLYLSYVILDREISVYKTALGKAELNYELAREDFKYDRILKGDFIEAEKEFLRASYELFKAGMGLKGIKRRLYEIVGLGETTGYTD